jgi:uncharacterized lipoprotein YddW (UPF0748 family)
MPLRSFALALLVLLAVGCSSSRDQAEPVSIASVPQGEAEIRAVWLTNVDSDILFSEQGIVDAVARLDAAGFNVLFPVVWNKGMTLYPSDVAERYLGIRIDTTLTPGHDPLAIVLREGHRRGMQVIPWFEFGFASSYNEGGGHILSLYPDWAARDIDGGLLTKNGFEWMNGLHPDVQDFMLALVDEVLTRYDVDGIQGDDRLPAMPSHGGYSEYSVGLYRSEHLGAMPPDDPLDPTFVQWKADKLSDFGTRLYDLVKAHGEDKIVSLSPSIYPWSRDEYLQDWPTWVRRGQVDWLHPQNYRYSIERYASTLDETVEAYHIAGGRAKGVKLAPGILVKAGPRYNGPAYVRQALDLHRALDLHGEAFFFYEGLFEQNEMLADTLRATSYRLDAPAPLLD